MSEKLNVAICGAGAWGTAMALHLDRQGHRVSLRARRESQARSIRETRVNADYLPGHALPESIAVETLDETPLEETHIVFMGAPSYALRSWLDRIAAISSNGQRLFVSLAKGLELDTGKTPCEIIAERFPDDRVGCLSGPTFAGEVASGKPAAMTLACNETHPVVEQTQAALSGPSMRIYLGEDLKGVELGGCLKNVYAIAAGCCQGLELGDNAQAALLTRALAEMVRVGQGLGANAETFYGLSGFGDLVATCHGDWSRNRSFGEAIAKGKNASSVIASQKTAVEGYRTARSFHETLAAKGVEAPILDQVYEILYQDKSPIAALNDLMSRDLKSE